MIYLDYAATSYPKSEEVYKAMEDVMRNVSVNAGRGSYHLAKKAEELIIATRSEVARLAAVPDIGQVVFAPSATIAANEILNGISWEAQDWILVSPYEHNAIMRTTEHLRQTKGLQIDVLPLQPDTLEIDIAKSMDLIHLYKPKLICLTQISNVTGYILPLEVLCKAAKEEQCLVCIDGAQGFGLLPLEPLKDCIDFYLFAGHKSIGGPFGIGGYINYSKYPLKPFLYGGNGSDSLNLSLPESGIKRYEVGSPDIIAIAGLQAAIENRVSYEVIYNHEQELIRYFRQQTADLDDLILFAKDTPTDKCLGIQSFAIEGFLANEVGQILDEEFDIAVRTGYHCAPLIHDALLSKPYGGTVRMSVGRYTTKEEIDRMVEALEDIMEYG